MYRVFLSSTSKDLQTHRQAVHDAIDRLGDFHLVKMEDFTAAGKSPRQLCDEAVRSCDLYVGLLGHYYGSRPPGEAKSFTELEYVAASGQIIDRLMFVAPDDLAIPANLREPDDSFHRQKAFRESILSAHAMINWIGPTQKSPSSRGWKRGLPLQGGTQHGVLYLPTAGTRRGSGRTGSCPPASDSAFLAQVTKSKSSLVSCPGAVG